MDINLAIITSEIHLSNFKNVSDKLMDICNIKYFVIKDLDECSVYYCDNIRNFDAFVLSGPTLYHALSRDVDTFIKPCYIINDDIDNIYKYLLKLITSKENFDISRVYIDFASEYNNYLDLKDIFSKEKTPVLLPWNSNDYNTIQENVLKNHIRLKAENKIDFSITRFGVMISKLEEINLDFHFLLPSEKHIYRTILNLVSEIKINRLNTNNIVMCNISLDKYSMKIVDNFDNTDSEYYLSAIQKSVSEFSKIYHYDLVIKKGDRFIELFLSAKDLYSITDNLKYCNLMSYLNDRIETPISIGFGMGGSLSQAKSNAFEANKYARELDSTSCFIIDRNGDVKGPMNKTNNITFSKSPDNNIIEASKKFNINPIHLQKIMILVNKSGTNKLSSKELSNFLSINRRSANRILNDIEEANGTITTYEKRLNSKGRPTKYYELIFLDDNGNLK